MEYVKICLRRVEDAARDAAKAIEDGHYEMAKGFIFDIDTWSKVAKSDMRKALRGDR